MAEFDFSGQKILVVGGAGFVGSNLVKLLLESGPKEVLVVDNLLSAERSNLPDDARVKLIDQSITNDAVLKDLPADLDYVFHLATFHGNQNSMADPLADHENNTLTTLKLFERIKDFKGLKKVVYAGAGCTVAPKTWGEADATTEETPPSIYLDTPYQMSKLIGEMYAHYYKKQHNLPVVSARFQNVYGPGEILGAGEWRGTSATVWRNVIPTFVYRAIKHMPLTVENEGLATRDFIHARDIARGLAACALRGQAGQAYNLASGVETSIAKLSETINHLAENPVPVSLMPKRDWDNSGCRYGSPDKATRELGFTAQVGLEEGLAETVAWTRATLPVIEACMARHASHMPTPTAV